MDRQSETWLSLKREIDAQIEKLRDDLERAGMPAESLRGEIASLRWVIAQVEVEPLTRQVLTVDYMQAHDPS